MGLTLVTDAAIDPVTIGDARAQCRIDSDSEENLLLRYIKAATRQSQIFTRRQFIHATYDYVVPKFSNEMEIPRSPLSSVTSIYYIDSDGDSVELDSATYDVDTSEEPGVVRLAFGAAWPICRSVYNAVTIKFVAATHPCAAEDGVRTASIHRCKAGASDLTSKEK